ncbi:transmembrane protein 161A isoform X3 [Sminthopsis crassicaudata]|uniref:transmembrane protein 161A isoform X3 n=1 Tax=Sminthopsis crassicaudata TaxID=9301 RepID=UPI003D68CD51
MAVMGVQLVVSLLTASLMHRMAPHFSFARWLLCNGSLFRYKHPTDEELRALAGKPKPKNKKERRANGLSEEKPLSVPRDINLQLETSPITAIDALVLRYFSEYQWFVDFALYACGVYLFTEAYYCVVDPAKEANIGVLWCLLTIIFSVKVFLTVMRLYFSSEEGGERSVCLAFAFIFLLLAMLVLVVREDILEFGLEPGLASITQKLEPVLKKHGWDWWLALHTSFLAPVLILCLWIKPIARDFLLQAPVGKTAPIQLLSDSNFDSVRLWLVLALCLLRLAVTRPHLQAYLCLAQRWVEQMRKEAGRIGALEIQRRITRIYCYVSVVSLQYLAPIILTLHLTLLLKTLGGYSWGLGPSSHPSRPAPAPAPASPPGDDEVQATVSQILGALSGLFCPAFCRGLLAFLTWWAAACQLLTSLFGLYFHQRLASS